MPGKNLKLGYFALPEGTPKNFPRKFLFLDKDKKIRVGSIKGPEMPYYQFARALSKGDITPTREGISFARKEKL